MAGPNEARDNTTPNADEIKEALGRTGFLLEYRVAQILRQHDCTVSINQAFPDPETGKSREIDVYAYILREVKQDPINLSVITELIVECKNSSAPFVLIGDHGQDYLWNYNQVLLSFDPLRLEFPKARHKRLILELDLMRRPAPAAIDEFTGYQFLRVSRQNNQWKADNNAIYDSILYPLAKAWRYQADKHSRDWKEDEEKYGLSRWQYPSIYYVLPIIVTSGQIFTVDVASGNSEVSEVKWARIKRSFNSEDLKGDLRSDVVSFDYWDEYVDSRLIKLADNAEDVLARNINFFDPEWLLSNFGKPEDDHVFNGWLSHFRKEKYTL